MTLVRHKQLPIPILPKSWRLRRYGDRLLLFIVAAVIVPGAALGRWHNEKDIQDYLATPNDNTEAEILYRRKLEAALNDPRLADEGVVWVDDGEKVIPMHPGAQRGSPAIRRGWALHYLTTPDGKDWLVTAEKGKQWLASSEGQTWLKSPGGKSWKEIQDRAPSGLALRVLGGDRLKLTWNNSGDRPAEVAIEYCAEGKPWSVLDKAPAGQTQYVAKGLATCTSYRFRLRGLGETNASALSETRAATTRPRTLHILAIGISRYADKKFEQKFAAADAKAFAAAWKKQEAQTFANVSVKILADEGATREQIAKGLAWLAENSTPNDWSLLMFSGRGVVDDTQKYLLCPYDFDVGNPAATAFSAEQIIPALEKAKGSLVFLDTPHSAAVAKGFSKDKGRLVLAAEGQGLDVDSLGHGAFTQAFLDCLAEPTKSDSDGDSLLSAPELEAAMNAGLDRWTSGIRKLTMLGSLSNPPLQVREK